MTSRDTVDERHRNGAFLRETWQYPDVPTAPQGDFMQRNALRLRGVRQAYVPLNREEEEIRFLVLEPGLRGSPLTIGLYFDSLKHPHPYIALSYTWGDEGGDRKVFFNSALAQENGQLETIGINENLYQALQHLRCEARHQIYWIDNLCINQTDEEEKSHEVKRMRRIYLAAWRVEVWLGPATDNSDRAISDMLRLCRSDLEWPFCNDAEFWDQFDTIAITQFLQRPWFRRVWVRQEIASAKEGRCVMICGDREFDPLVLPKLMARLFLLKSRDYQLVSFLKRWPELFEDRNVVKPLESLSMFIPGQSDYWENMPLISYLYVTQRLQATNPRDHVFGILGLAQDAHLLDDVVDYSASVEQIYARTMKVILGLGPFLDFFSFLGHTDGTLTLPSWVPDFRLGADHDVCGISLGPYFASRMARARMIFSEDLKELELYGFTPTDVKFVSDVCKSTRYKPGWPEPLLPILKTFEPFLNEHFEAFKEHYGSDAAVENAFWRTITADVRGTDHPYSRENDEQMDKDGSERGLAQAHRRWPADTDAEAYRLWALKSKPRKSQNLEERNMAGHFNKCAKVCYKRRLFISWNGHMGLAPQHAQPRDYIALIRGGRVPYVLRHDEDTMATCKLIGDAYVHGIMDGEIYPGPEDTTTEFRIWLN